MAARWLPGAFCPTGVNGLRMLGILHDAVVFLIEQLSGAKHCRNYKFRFHKPEEANEPPLNPHGSARAEVHLRQVPFSFLSSFGFPILLSDDVIIFPTSPLRFPGSKLSFAASVQSLSIKACFNLLAPGSQHLTCLTSWLPNTGSLLNTTPMMRKRRRYN